MVNLFNREQCNLSNDKPKTQNKANTDESQCL